jgi:predicted HAD superfamily Cof-like phosphohydrolase
MAREKTVIDMHNDLIEFHKQFQAAIGTTPKLPNYDLQLFRANLLLEEFSETWTALGWTLLCPHCGQRVKHPLKEFSMTDVEGLDNIADGCIDLMYVIIGLLVAYGIDFRPLWKEVHRANMSKIGGKKRQDGKQLKPKDWQPPDIVGLLNKQPSLKGLK